MYIVAFAVALLAILFAFGAAKVAGDADRQSDVISRRLSGRSLPHRP